MGRRRGSVLAPVVLPLVMLLALPGAIPPAQARAGAADGAGYLTGPRQGAPEDIAVEYLRAEAGRFGLSRSDVAELTVRSSYATAHNGLTHVNLGQRYRGLDVFDGYATVNVARDGRILFIGETLVADLRPAMGAAAADAAAGATGDPAGAVTAAAEALDLAEPRDLRVLEGGPEETVVSDGGISEAPIPVRLGWQPTPTGLRLAYQVVIDDVSDVNLWNATVDAGTGELLDVDDWTVSERVEDIGSVLARAGTAAGPRASTAAVPAAPSPASGAESLAASGPQPPVQVDDGSSYRVYEFPLESPNDGDRRLVTNPADDLGSPYGWHDTDGAAGPEHTVTRGNNVHAYTDRDANGVPDPGSDPDAGTGLDFDYPADLGEHAQTYADAAVANLFYANNVIHDVLYRYGFDEASGNFQVNNYGRGGAGGDDVRAEAADGAGQNNANFSTPAQDGGRPRMQMYLWPGAQFGRPNAVTIDAGTAAGTYLAEYARFTPAPTSAGTSGQVVQVDDGPLFPTDGCEPYSLEAGTIAVVDRTSVCSYSTQVANAEAAGAAAVIVVNNASGNPVVMSGSMEPPAGIPAVMVSQEDGATLKAGLPAAGRVHRNTARPPIRDGDFENGIIIHEYGHGVSNRLTGGPNTNCLSGHEQMGEGWSDFLAISLLIDPALDDPEGRRGMGPYALFQSDRTGGGIRPRPYSRNMAINEFTYDHIKTGGWNGGNLSVPHGIGWGWATVLWDMTWNLIDKHGFNPNIYDPATTGGNNLAIQLVMDGLKIQGCGPGFVVGRDAIIAADQADTGGENYCLIWRTFARRGLGYSAVQGTTDRNDNTQAFDLPPECRAEVQVDPGSLDAAVMEGRSASQQLTISNLALVDGEPLAWTITEATTDCSSPSDLGWLATDPASGATGGAASSQVAVTFDTAGLTAPDRHEGLLCVGSNDADTPTVAIPVSLQVQYPISGFGRPVDQDPSLNRRTAGSSVPIKFSLGGDRGLGFLAPGSPSSQQIDCTTRAPLGAATPTQTSGSSTLHYDASTDTYTYPWQTQSSWAGTCRQFQLRLDDGSTHVANFRFA